MNYICAECGAPATPINLAFGDCPKCGPVKRIVPVWEILAQPEAGAGTPDAGSGATALEPQSPDRSASGGAGTALSPEPESGLLAARWEENARELLRAAIEFVEELRCKCDDPVHDQQLKELRAIESEWAGVGVAKKPPATNPSAQGHLPARSEKLSRP